MKNEQLKDILLLQNKSKPTESFVNRDLLSELNKFKNTSFVKIISGIRRSGKSTVLQQIRSDNDYYVNFDDERFFDFTVNDFQRMYELLVELFGRKKTFLFDEIQNISGWERFVRRLHNEGLNVFVTGSNASMLSRELGTHLTGRNISFELFPFSFNEFLIYKGREISNLTHLTSIEKSEIKKIFFEYFQQGGFPEFLNTEKDEYLINLYENILYRDIIARYNLKSERPIKLTAHFAASNIGKEISFNKIRKLTGLSSATTIKEYFQYMENSYLLFLLPRYNYSLKKQIYSNKKVYFIDSKLPSLIGFRFSEDKGRILENIVFLELKRRKYDIYFHREKQECDFILQKQSTIEQAIQVTWTLDEHNYKREISGLIEALKMYQIKNGLILTYDQEDKFKEEDYEISLVPVWKWLLQ